MRRLFEKTVSAICYDVARAEQANPGPMDPPPNDLTHFVLRQWDEMPRFLAWPVRLATLIFAWRGVVLTGRFFHSHGPERRRTLIESWRHSSLGPCRDFVRFYRSLALLAYYDRESGA